MHRESFNDVYYFSFYALPQLKTTRNVYPLSWHHKLGHPSVWVHKHIVQDLGLSSKSLSTSNKVISRHLVNTRLLHPNLYNFYIRMCGELSKNHLMAINIMWFFLLVLEIYMVLSHEIQICCFKKKFFNSKILLKSTSKPQSFPSSLLKVGSTKGSLISFKTKKFLTFSLHHTHPNKIVYLKDNTDI